MFNASFAEVLFILILAFVILGPEKLATTAQTLGLGLKRIKLWYTNLQNDLNKHDS